MYFKNNNQGILWYFDKIIDLIKLYYIYNIYTIKIDFMNFGWSEEKNKILKETRNISFEEIVEYINNGFVIKEGKHPNQEKYSNQRIYYININNYIYQVPYVIDRVKNIIFLKTIIPTRKWTKILLNK